MSTFSVTDNNQVLDAINYALSNLGQNTTSSGNTGNAVTINTTTGQVSQGTSLLSYYYQYINVRYADSSTGSVNFSTSPTNRTYFGVLNNASASPSTINNPSAYQWTQVAGGGFGTTKFLFYSTLGGRQISWSVSTTSPGSSFVQTTDSTAINLDFVTATNAVPVVVMTAFQRANTLPSTPTGGTYDFGNLIFTAPTGWANSIPSGSSNLYSSQNTFKSTSTGNVTVGPQFAWTTPVITIQNGANGTAGANGANGVNGYSTYLYNVFQAANATPSTPTGGSYTFNTGTGVPPTGWLNYPSSNTANAVYVTTATVQTTTPNVTVTGLTWSSPTQYSGGNGTPGPRGFIPMGYVLTPSNPATANSITLSQWFQASTAGNTAPVGTGYPPVGGDTAAFTFSSNSAQVAVYTYNSGNSTWTTANGQVINGNVFVTGSVNSNKLAANDIYTLKLQSTNANFGNNSSFGFWLDAATGNARLAGNVNIGNTLTIGANAVVGNNLIIGNNATIGGNLTIGGLTTNGALNANVVTDSAIASGVSGGKISAGTITATQISASYIYAGNIVSTNGIFNNINSPGYWMNFQTGDARFGGNVNVGNNLVVGNLITASALNANTVSFNNIQPGIVGQPITGPYYVSPTATMGPGNTNYTGSTVNFLYRTLAYITIPPSSAYFLTGAANPSFTFNFSANLAFSTSLAGTSYPVLTMYVLTQQAANASPNITASYTHLGNEQFYTNTNSFSGTVSYSYRGTLPTAYWTSTTNCIVGVAYLVSPVSTYYNALTSTFSNLSWVAAYGT